MARVKAARALAKIILADQAPYRRVTGNQALDEIGAGIVGVDIEAMLGRDAPCRDQRHRTVRLAVEEGAHDARLQITQRGHELPPARRQPSRPRPPAPRAREYQRTTQSRWARLRIAAAPRATN